MSKKTKKRIELKTKISKLPDSKIGEVAALVDSILAETENQSKRRGSLEGIWRDIGFEKIMDLEAEIKEVRKNYWISFCP